MEDLIYFCLRTILLCIAIILIAIGIHTSNYIFICIGGAMIGVYNVMIIDGED